MSRINRYKANEVADALDNANFPPAALILRGMGWKDGSEDVRRFRGAVLQDEVRPTRSALLASAIGNAICAIDLAGNVKLTKGTSGNFHPRDDCCAAAILAVAEGVRNRNIPAPTIEYAIAGAI